MTDLVFSLGGDTSAFERAMANVASVGIRRANELETLFKGASQRIDASIGTSIGSAKTLSGIMGGLRVAGTAFLAFEALKTVIGAVSEAARDAQKDLGELVAIGTKARDLGVGSGFLQGFTGQAKDLGLEKSQLEAMLATAREASTLRIGEGDSKASSTIDDRLRQNVLAGNLPASAQASFDAAGTQEQRIRVMLDLMEQLQAKGAQLAALDLGKTMFGEDFERAARTGVDVVDAMRRSLDGVAATSEGRVRTEEEIANAQRISAEYADQDRRLAAAWADYEAAIAAWKQDQLQLMVDLRGLYVDVVEAAAKMVGWLMRGVDAIGALNQGAESLMAKLAQMTGAGAIHHFLFPNDTAGTTVSFDAPPLTIRPKNDTSHSLPSLTPAHERAAHEPAAKADEVDNYIKSLNKSVAAIEGEAAALGKSNAEKERSIDLSKADEAARERGTALTEAEREKIIALADATSAAKAKIAEFNAAQQHAAEQAQFLGSTFESAIEGMVVSGKSLTDTLADLVRAFESAALKAAILGEGPLASLFGTAPATGATGSATVGGLFGALTKSLPHFAGGGPISGPGGPRSDSIPALVSPGEYIVNAEAFRRFPGLVEAINSGRIGSFADGGPIVLPGLPGASGAVPGGSAGHQTINFNVTSPDAPSFARSEGQLTAMLARATARGQRNL